MAFKGFFRFLAHFRHILGHLRAIFRTKIESFLTVFGPFWGSIRGHLGSLGDHFRIVLASFWGRFGIVLTSFWGDFDAFFLAIFRPFLVMFAPFLGHFYGHFAGGW